MSIQSFTRNNEKKKFFTSKQELTKEFCIIGHEENTLFSMELHSSALT